MAISITQQANPAGQSASSNVATYSDVSLGTENVGRMVVVLVGTELTAATIDSCTIDYGLGDIAMNAGTQGSYAGTVLYARCFYLFCPTGTTATIKVTFGANPTSAQNHIAVYIVREGAYSAAGGDGSSDIDSTDALTTGSNTIPTGGGIIAVAACATDTAGKAWANITEDLDADVGGFRFTTATSTTAGTATRTCTGANNEDGALSWLNFTPALNIFVSDALTITDDDVVAIDLVIDVFDSLTIEEDETVFVEEAFEETRSVDIYDEITISENIVNSRDSPIDVYDSLEITEEVIIIADLAVDSFDSLTISEDIILSTTSADLDVDIYDDLSMVEDISYTGDSWLDIFEELTITDEDMVIQDLAIKI